MEPLFKMNKNKSLTVLTTMVLCACYIMTATLFLSLKNFNNFILAWGKDLQMTVYLKEDAQNQDVEELIKTLKSKAEVQEVTKVSAEENFSQFKKQMGSLMPEIQSQSEVQAMIPSTLQVLFNLKDTLGEPVKAFARVAESIQSQNAVDQVSYGQIWVDKFSKFFVFIRQALWVTSILLLVASIFVFSNSVRAWIESKRFEIEVMELVGATSWMIRKPFVIRGAVLGALAGSVAVGFVFAAIGHLKQTLSESDMLATMASRLECFNGTEAAAFVIFSVVLGVLASYLCVREINSGWAAIERP
jgi:cell division transport system permease protein